jgi:HEAT repeat protein
MGSSSQIGSIQTIDALHTALADEDAEVRLYAEEALETVQTKRE